MKVINFVNFAFQNSLVPLINKPTRVNRTNATAIEYILTNAFINKQIETCIIKTKISDHFPIFLFLFFSYIFCISITSSELKNKRTLFY